MVKASELRIENYFLGYDNKPFQWSLSDFELLCTDVEIDDIIKSPIPLTEDWLLKLGFKKWKNKNNWSIGSLIVYTIKDLGFCYGGKSLRVNIKHVHQLQNLFFALCGEELQIKELETTK